MGNRWSLSHTKITHFRTSLRNPLTSQLFRRYVSAKGDRLENNILFWQETQKYKVSRHDVLIVIANVIVIITKQMWQEIKKLRMFVCAFFLKNVVMNNGLFRVAAKAGLIQ